MINEPRPLGALRRARAAAHRTVTFRSMMGADGVPTLRVSGARDDIDIKRIRAEIPITGPRIEVVEACFAQGERIEVWHWDGWYPGVVVEERGVEILYARDAGQLERHLAGEDIRPGVTADWHVRTPGAEPMCSSCGMAPGDAPSSKQLPECHQCHRDRQIEWERSQVERRGRWAPP